MFADQFAFGLKNRIEQTYADGKWSLGWRLLYSPESTLHDADVAFLGINPGGRYAPENHAEFAMESGSAYEIESWKNKPPGEAPLQRQVRALFSKIGIDPSEVLAGNIVPFRSPNWDKLPKKQCALAFGKDLWGEILGVVKPKLVIAMGKPAINCVCEILKVEDVEEIPVNWGYIVGKKGRFHGGKFVGLPHLSQYKLLGRSESAAALDELLAP